MTIHRLKLYHLGDSADFAHSLTLTFVSYQSLHLIPIIRLLAYEHHFHRASYSIMTHSTTTTAWAITHPSFPRLLTSSTIPNRTRRRPRSSFQTLASPTCCETPSITSKSSSSSSSSTEESNKLASSFFQYGLLTDSILEVKWKKEKEKEKHAAKQSKFSSPDSISSKQSLPSVTIPDDICASDPYKAFAHFTRIAAPTAAIGHEDEEDDNHPNPFTSELSVLPTEKTENNGTNHQHERKNLSPQRQITKTSPYSAAAIAHRLMRYSYAQQNLADFLQFFCGEFDNYEQIAMERAADMMPREGGGHEHIHCSLTQVSNDMLFARYYFNGDPSFVFRSRLYKVNVSDASDRGIIEMKIYRFYEETEQLLKSNNYDLDAVSWNDDDVYDWLEGCEVYWEAYRPPDEVSDDACRQLEIQSGTRFVGYMKGGGCELYSNEIQGRIRVMDDLLLTRDDLWVADRGFDDDNNFVYGNRRGIPYKMKRVHQGDMNAWTLSANAPAPEGYVP